MHVGCCKWKLEKDISRVHNVRHLSRYFSVPPPRPQDKPLAVPPGQVDEGDLATARAEYRREKDRIRAKRMQELRESADLKLR